MTEVIDRPTPPALDAEVPNAGRPDALTGLPLLLGGGLLAVVLYAAFDHGAVGLAPGARVEVAVAALGAVGALAWLGLDALRLRASRLAFTGLALLTAFACWSGITVLWSVAPDQTWVELNRALAYVIVLGLAIGIGAAQPRAPALLGRGFLVVATGVTIYALAQKLVPGLHIPGVFDLNQTGTIPRLQEPIGYWNALALFLVLAATIALQVTVDPTGSPRLRLFAAGVLELMLVTIGLTLSRGGLVALAAALIVVLGGARQRLRVAGWFALVALAAAPPLALGLTLRSLTAAGVSLGSREAGGAILAGVLAVSLGGLCLAGRFLLAHESRLRLAPGSQRRARDLGLAGLTLLVLGAGAALVLTHAWQHFTSPMAPSNLSPSRLLTTDSYRWLWWKEAARAFAARPVGGWGAGSFGVVHLIYRQNTLPVQQPHSVPLQFLSETGVVGAMLGLGGLAVLLLAAVRSARARQLTATERGAAMALLAGGVAYLVHCLYDWDWNIPAVTVPALMFLGVLAGTARAGAHREVLRETRVLGTRALALTGATLWLGLFTVSALLPSLSASDSDAALIQASGASSSALADAQAKASRASALDPLSDGGLRAEASIALHRGQLPRARYDLERAVGREPSDELAWNELAAVDGFLGDRVAALQAARRVAELDPRGSMAQALKRAGLLAAHT